MLRHWSIAAVIGALGLIITPAHAVPPPLNLTIEPERAQISPGNDLIIILCKSDVPLTQCQFKVRHNPVYDFSAGDLSPKTKEYSYYGEGLDEGECGIKLSGQALEFDLNLVGCRAKTNTSDWAFRETTLVNKPRDAIPVTITPRRTLIVQPGDPINVLVDAHKPLTLCTFALANDFGKVDNRRRFNFDMNNVAGSSSPRDTDIEYRGAGVDKGQCGFHIPTARDEVNDGAWVDVVDDEDHEETLFFRIIVARPPILPTLMYNTTNNPDGSLDVEAWCSVRSRPASNITWYLQGKPIEEKFSEFVPVQNWLWPSNIQPVTEKLTLRLNSEHLGDFLWCAVDHISLKAPLESKKIKIKIVSPPSTPILNMKSPYFAERSTLEATCRVDNWSQDATITWYLGGVVLRQDKHNDDAGAPAGAKTITQHLKHLLERRENGLDLRCEADHFKLVQPLRATRQILFTYCSPLISKTVRISCSVDGEQVDCAEPQQVGTVAQLACKPGHILSSNIVYRRVTCLRAVRWDRPVFACTPACGKRNTNSGTPQISGGVETKIGEFPWHVGIYEMKSATGVPEQFCSGTLISPDIVVSAAHCFWSNNLRAPKDASLIKIAAGKHVRDWVDTDPNVQKRNVSQIILPLRYSGRLSKFASDVALLRLSTELEMTATVNLICVDWESELERFQLRVGSVGTVAGWGYTNETSELSRVLKYVNLRYVSPDDCTEALSDELEPVFTHDKFCAGFVNQSTSVCRGDSGGGLVFRHPGTDKYYLRGIVSIAFTPASHDTKCYSQLYTGFTRFSMFLSWVQENV